MDYLISSKGRRQLILDGYLFKKRKVNSHNIISWECVERRNRRACSVCVKTLDDQVMAHCHLQGAKVHGNTKELVKTTNERSDDIISNAATGESNVSWQPYQANILSKELPRQIFSFQFPLHTITLLFFSNSIASLQQVISFCRSILILQDDGCLCLVLKEV